MFASLKNAADRAEQVHGFTDYIRAAGCIMTTAGYGEAARRAGQMGWPKIAEVLQKAAIPGASTSANSITTLLGPFMQAVRNIGVVDRIAGSAMRLPDRFTGKVTVFSSVAASTIAEGAAKTLKISASA